MEKEHLSADQRLSALEQTIPGIQQSLAELSDMVNSMYGKSGSVSEMVLARPVGTQALLFEQVLGLARTVNLLHAPGDVSFKDTSKPARFYVYDVNPPPGCTDCIDCTKYVFVDDRIKGTHTVVLEPTAPGGGGVLACLTLAKILVIDGRAEATICCKRDAQGQIVNCVGKTRLSVRDPLNPVPATGGGTIPAFVVGEFITKSCGPLPNGGA
jgi:hypothetical protein